MIVVAQFIGQKNVSLINQATTERDVAAGLVPASSEATTRVVATDTIIAPTS